VAVRHSDVHRIVHPEIGLLDLMRERLVSSVNSHVLVVLCPRPGTDAREKLDLLRVIGVRDLAAAR
jgi:hypothetical protein